MFRLELLKVSMNYHQKEDNTKYKVINNAIDIIKYGLPSMSSLIVNKNFYLNLKTTDENLKWGEDILLYLLMTKYGKGIKFNNSYAMYLINEDGRGSQLKFTYRLNLSIALFKQALVGPRKTESMFYSLFYSARYFSTYILKKLNLIR